MFQQGILKGKVIAANTENPLQTPSFLTKSNV
jgi:hypothetical protein